MQLARLAFSALLSAFAVFAADVNGKWTAEINTNNGPVQVTMQFKAEGETLTGVMSTHMGDLPIKEGKVKGDELSWVATVDRDGNSMRIQSKAKVTGAEMNVTVTIEGREDRTIEYTAKKSS